MDAPPVQEQPSLLLHVATQPISPVQTASQSLLQAGESSATSKQALDQQDPLKTRDMSLAPVEESSLEDQLDGTSDRQPHLKTETSASGNDPATGQDATLQAIAVAQNEFTTRVRQAKTQAEDGEMPVVEEKPKQARKRAGPKPHGVRKPPAKKLKMDALDDRGTAASARRSATPASASGRAPKAKGRKGSTSATPFSSSPPAQSPEPFSMSDVEDADALYCICRRPDNHTFMIACDGGCEDWFHGRCVNMKKEDEDLVDKYICPNCEAKGPNVTTWKPMCRRPGCRKPARLRKGSESKYCSEECGIAFFQGHVEQTGLARTQRQSPRSRKLSKGDRLEAAHDSAPDLGPMGGPIRPHELKALAMSAPDASTFRHLGDSSVLTPSKSPSKDMSPESQPLEPLYTPAEESRLAAISTRKNVLRERRTLLKDRERFVVLVKERAGRLAETSGIKELCGMDPRLSWDDRTFERWRDSEAGRDIFERGTLDSVKSEETKDLKPRPLPIQSSTTTNTATVTEEVGDEVCMKKRCERHRTWQKLVLQDVRFEEADVGDEMRRIDGEERELRERALGRARMKMGGIGAEDGAEDTVEAVGEEEGDVDGEIGREGEVDRDGDVDMTKDVDLETHGYENGNGHEVELVDS